MHQIESLLPPRVAARLVRCRSKRIEPGGRCLPSNPAADWRKAGWGAGPALGGHKHQVARADYSGQGGGGAGDTTHALCVAPGALSAAPQRVRVFQRQQRPSRPNPEHPAQSAPDRLQSGWH